MASEITVEITVFLHKNYSFGEGAVQIIFKKDVSLTELETKKLVDWTHNEVLGLTKNDPGLKIETSRAFEDCTASALKNGLVEEFLANEGVGLFTIPKKEAKKRLVQIITNIAGKDALIKKDDYGIMPAVVDKKA